MRILIVAHTTATWTPYFARHFASRGWVVKVVSFSPDPIDGIDVEFVGVEPFDKHRNKHLFLTRVPRVRRIAKTFAPDIIFAPYLSSNGLTAVLASAAPVVVAAVGSDVMNNSGRRGVRLWFRHESIRFVCRRSRLVNTVSQDLTNELVRLGVPCSQILQLPFGVDTGAFSPAADAPREMAARLISTRRHEPLYDIETIIDGLVSLKKTGLGFQCTFTSGGALFESHRQRAIEGGLEDRVVFTGQLGHGELPALLRQADIYISASLTDGTSVALLEAMAAGLMPVVSRIPANIPWVQHGVNGLLFDCGDAKGLARCVERALSDQVLRRRAFELNRPRVDREANMSKNIERLAEAMERIAGVSAPRISRG